MITAPLASCVGSCCGAAACAGFTACCSCNVYLSLRASRVVYTAVVFVATAAALAAKYWGADLAAGGGDECLFCGDAGVLRITFGLACTFLLLALLTLGDTHFGRAVHTGFWFAKLVVLGGTIAGGAFLPVAGLALFSEVCRWCAFLFLLFQIVMLIDFAYSWNEAWAVRDDEGAGEFRWRGALLLASLALFAFAITGVTLMLRYMSPPGCTLNVTLVSCTLVAFVAFSALSISPLAEHGALLTSAVLSAYLVFVAFSALKAVPDAACNPLAAGEYDDLRLAAGLVFAAISLAYPTWAYGGKYGEEEEEEAAAAVGAPPARRAYQPSGGGADPFQTLAGSRRGAGGAVSVHSSPASLGERGAEPPLPPSGARALAASHAVGFAVSAYAAMLLTGWRTGALELDQAPGGAAGGADGGLPYQFSWASVWIQVASVACAACLYTWTLVAPALFPDRDFGLAA